MLPVSQGPVQYAQVSKLCYNGTMRQQDTALVSAQEVILAFNIPRTYLYRLVQRGKIRAHYQPRQPYHERRRLLFRLSEVEEDLALLPKPKP